MKNIAIIPARGGSRRIPHKNVKPFLGRPILSYPIAYAQKSGLFDEIMVSTDDRDIEKIAREFGANVPFLRSGKNSDDFATTVDVLIEVIDMYIKMNLKFDYICCIYPTAVFAREEILVESYKFIKKNKGSSLIPIVKYSHPIQRSLKVDNNNAVEYYFPEHQFTRTQDLPDSFHDAGQFYWIKVSDLLREKKLVFSGTIGFEISPLHAQDIDNEIDWQLAEYKYKFLTSKNQRK